MPTNPPIATDSATELHKLIGDDATATFESDPTFIDSNPTGSASSESLDEQRLGAGQEFIESKSAKSAGADEEDEDEDEDEEDDDDEEDEDDEDADDVDDGVDEDDDLDDEEDEDDDDYEDDEDEDEDDEDDADEVKASASSSSEMLRADGLLGYEDEAQDVKKGVDRVTGDVDRKRDEARKLTDDPDENPNDAYAEVDPAAERDEQADSDVVIRPVKPADLGMSAWAAA